MKKFLLLLFVPAICFGQIKVSPEDYAWKPVGEPGFAPQSYDYFDFASAPDGTPYVAFFRGDGLLVKKFNGTEWVLVGNLFKTDNPQVSIDISRSGVPYVAFCDSSGIQVIKYNGSSWEYLVSPGLTTPYPDLSIKVDTNEDPVIALELVPNGKLSILKYDGSTWNYLGVPSFTPTTVESSDLDINKLNEPVVVYIESLVSQSISVQIYRNGQWEYLGPRDFAENVMDVNLKINHTGIPYIVFHKYTNGNKTWVMKYNGINWENVGSGAISDGATESPDISFNQSDIPFVVYADVNDGYKTSVKSFQDGTWQLVGDNGFSSDTVVHPLIEMMNDNPIVVYADYSENHWLTSKSYDSVYVGVKELSTPIFTIFPNPASQFIHIKEDCNDKGFYKVTDLQGRCIIDWKAISKDIYTGNLKSGLYIISFISKGVINNQKLIIL